MKFMPLGETAESQQQSRDKLKSLSKQNAPNQDVVKQLTRSTFYIQRKEVNNGKEIKYLLEDWPFLFDEIGMAVHFEELTGVSLKETFVRNLDLKGERLLNYLKTVAVNKSKRLVQSFTNIQLMRREHTGPSGDLLEMVLLLLSYFDEKEDVMFTYVEDTCLAEEVQMDQVPLTPTIVVCGQSCFSAKRWMLSVDRMIVQPSITSFIPALCLMFGSFYVFNIHYPVVLASTLEFLQRCFFSINPERGTKVENTSKSRLHVNPRVLTLIQDLSDHEWCSQEEEAGAGPCIICGALRTLRSERKGQIVLMSFIYSGLTQALPKTTLTVTPDIYVFTGETVSLKCVIESDQSDWRYEWYKYTVNKPMSLTPDRHTLNSKTLTIRAANKSDEDQYWCRGQRDEKTVSDVSPAVHLYVKDLPTSTLTVTPDSLVFTGETVNLKCEIEYYSDWTNDWRYKWPYYQMHEWRYEWYKGNRNNSMLQTSERYTVNGNTLTIRVALMSDVGQYRCKGQRDERPNSSQSSSAVSLSVADLPISTLTVTPDNPVFTGETVNLKCVIEYYSNWRQRNHLTNDQRYYWPYYEWRYEWRYEWFKGNRNNPMLQTSEHYTVNKDTLTIRGATEFDQDQYMCRGQRNERPKSSHVSAAVSLTTMVRPKPVVKVSPDQRVFRGETVTLTCDIQGGGNIQWTYSWFKDGSVIRDITERVYTITSVSDSGEYSCRGERLDSQRSDISAAVTLTVSAEAQAAVRVSPQPWLTEGDSVTLICEVTGSSTGWTFSWFRDDDHLSDSSRGAGGSYTLSPAALQHTGVYTCRAERGRPAFNTNNSSTQPLWITGVSPSVSLEVSPSRSQHFSSDSLSLSCEDQSNSAGWTVRRYTDRNTEDCSKQTGSTCRIVSLSTSDTGVYWCQSESGEKHHPLNITVHDGDVILVSSVDPVIEGDTLTLHCLHRSTNSPILRADFYKDGSLVQSQTTGEMSITSVSKSHEGFYYCKTERGQSLHSWISVRASYSGQISVFNILSFLLAACPYLLSTVVLLFKCYRARVAIVRWIFIKPHKRERKSSKNGMQISTLQKTTRRGRCGGKRRHSTTSSEERNSSKNNPIFNLTVLMIFIYSELTQALPKPTLTVTPDNTAFTGETVSLKCVIESDQSDWRYEWYKYTINKPMSLTPDHHTVNRDTLTIRGALKSDQGQYWCRGQRDEKPASDFSAHVYLSVKDVPTSTLTVTPDSLVFTGETVNLKCEIESYSDWTNDWRYKWAYYQMHEWRYEWYKGNRNNPMLQMSERYTVNGNTLTIRVALMSDVGLYTCKGQRDKRPNSSQSSSAVSLSVAGELNILLKWTFVK
ncbi:hypothetical protein QQF64_031180 [Cirrhinus molitorella]|uniref:Ig-like domain-containing protein n=1 Tax=Cirrhinus molitorella TaxID=172907 RepID=A0ABR3N5E5_9TELE